MASLEGIISLGPWGGSGGSQWRFRASSGITEIIIYVNSIIPVAISFRDDKGYISGKFGGENENDTGKEIKINIGWPSEYITTISGTYGRYAGLTVITSLTFITNNNTYGPFGEATGDVFSIPIVGSVVVGFHGRSGHYLDALGIFVRPDATISLGPWGGQGGGPFSFKAASWIKQITIYDGQCITAIAFKDSNDVEYGKFGGHDPNDPGTRNIIELDGPSEYLTSITGTYGSHHNVGTPVITSLSFITNLATHGPFGTATGTSFFIPIEGSFVNGFHGRYGYYLDAVGIFVKPKSTI